MNRVCVLLVALFALCVHSAPFSLESTFNTAYANIQNAPKPTPTGLSRNSYLQTFSGITGYFRTIQDNTGAIIDPVLGREVQYATPCFAHAAIVQSAVNGDVGLLNAGLFALNSSLDDLVTNKCADSHCNFFTLPVMNAIEAARPAISSALYQYYLTQAAKIQTSIYTNNGINWGIVAAAGEYIRNIYGLGTRTYIESILSQHISLFSDNGLYMDPTPASNPSTAYDIFPRLYLENMLFRGYNGTNFAGYPEILRRSSLVSLLLQSPQGEWPTGGRSSQHQWNEAAACALFEFRANFYKAQGDMVLASAFKRAAHLSLQSFQRWVTETGYAYVVKNRFPIQQRWGYQDYSHLTNYNGLPASMLAIAFSVADDTIPEGPTFAETGGYVFEVPSHHKIIANIKGTYLEFEAQSDPDYDSTGLVRVHTTVTPTLIGPTAGATGTVNGTAVGVAWTKGGVTEALAQFGTKKLVGTYLTNVVATPDAASFTVTYKINGSTLGVTEVAEYYSVTSNNINVGTTVLGDVDTVTLKYPILTFDGTYNYSYNVIGSSATVYGGVDQSYTVTSPSNVLLQFNPNAANSRNGYLGVAYATVPASAGQWYNATIAQCPGCVAPKTLRVGSSNQASYSTISAALVAAKALNAPYVVEIESGTYSEKVVVDAPQGTLRPTSDAAKDSVVISYAPTSASDASLSITAAAFEVKIYGLVVLKSASEVSSVGSALTIDGESASVYLSSFLGFNSVVSIGRVKAYFHESYFEGGNSMITGSGTAYFDSCKFASNSAGAVATHFGVSSGDTDKWVFNNAELLATAPSARIASLANPSRLAVSAGQTFVGRAGDEHARISYFFSGFASNVNTTAWQATGDFIEFQNDGASGAFTKSRALAASVITGEERRVFELKSVLGDGNFAPTWVDPVYAPSCGGAYAQCGGNGFSGKTCCQAPFACVARDATFAQCTKVALSPPSNGNVNILTTGTIGLSTIYIYNPYGTFSVANANTGVYASVNASYTNAVSQSIYTAVAAQRSPTPTLNITVYYSGLSDPRGIEVDLVVTLPLNSKVSVLAGATPVPQPTDPTVAPTPPPFTDSAAHQGAVLSLVAVVVAGLTLFL